MTKRKSKNNSDLYRSLLEHQIDSKVNNDVWIPRSILKRNNPGNLIKDTRLEQA